MHIPLNTSLIAAYFFLRSHKSSRGYSACAERMIVTFAGKHLLADKYELVEYETLVTKLYEVICIAVRARKLKGRHRHSLRVACVV